LYQRSFTAAAAIAVLLTAGPARAAAPSAPDGLVWNLTPAQIAATCDASIKTADGTIHGILVGRTARTFDTVILPLENASADLSDALAAPTFLSIVAVDKPVRDASNDCQTKENNFLTALAANPDLETAVAAAIASNTADNAYDKKLSELWHTSLVRSGAALNPTDRAEFVKLSDQLNDLELKFGTNLAEDATTITLTHDQVAGVPADVLASFKAGPNGTYIVPVNESTADFLTYATDESGRKAFYLAYNNRAAAQNIPLLEQAIAIRDRLAHLMGYENWAAYVLADRMASSPARVEKFLTGLDQQILPKARQEIATLTALKAKETGNTNATLHPWDTSHFDHVLNKTTYAVDSDAIRQYFPVQHTIDAVLNIYHTLLGVNFAQVANPDVWAPDVLEYSVTDGATGKLIGYTYFDLFPRPGKFEHFENVPIIPFRVTSDGSRVPVSAIVGNWPRPAPGNPALLSHDDVVTFFHEFGHNMAALLATAPYETLSAGFREDFVEAPSQMLENFVWQPSILKEISSNWQTHQPLPDDMIAKLIAAKHVNYAYFTTRQIMLAQIDMAYHTSGPHVDTTKVWSRIAQADTPMPLTPGIHPQASFGHIMGGYDAGYYGYLWSKVYAQDMFTAFLDGGLQNPAVGARYRQTILQPARAIEPDQLVTNFLGRPMSPNAFYSDFGIGAPGGQ
jgi:thimet oligopeptidase